MPTKDLLQSKTAWGTIIGFAALIAHQLGFDIGDQTGIVNDIVGLIGAALAIYGRVTAVHKITSVAGVKTGS